MIAFLRGIDIRDLVVNRIPRQECSKSHCDCEERQDCCPSAAGPLAIFIFSECNERLRDNDGGAVAHNFDTDVVLSSGLKREMEKLIGDFAGRNL